jgi:hypothetical protein
VRHDAGVTPTEPAAALPPAPPNRRSRLALALAWLLATVLAATVAWWAVTAVGGERGGEGASLESQAQVERRLAEQGAATDGGRGEGPAVAEPERSPLPVPTTSPTPTPGAPSAGGPTTAPTPVPDPAPAAPSDVARTWDVAGGQVGAVCSGTTIGLLHATPAAGWSVEVEHAGPAELEVEFSRDDDDSRVRAECVAGTPEITHRGDDGDDDSGGDDGEDDD